MYMYMYMYVLYVPFCLLRDLFLRKETPPVQSRNEPWRRPSLVVPIHYVLLTHWGHDKMAAILQTTLSNAFSWIKMFEFQLELHWGLFLNV